MLVAVLALLTLAIVAFAQTGGGYDLTWFSVDGGGGTSSGGSYALSGAAGQPDAGVLSAAGYTLSGGFLPGLSVAAETPTPTETPPTPSFSPTPTDTPPTPSFSPTPTPTSRACWVTILSESFEAGFPGVWRVSDSNSQAAPYQWGKRACRPYAGSYSGWAVGGGASGSALACGSNYVDNADCWMLYGPFSLQDASTARVSFQYWLQTEQGYDKLFCGVSIDGDSFHTWPLSGSSNGWQQFAGNLNDITDAFDLAGQSQVWLGFLFQSDASLSLPEGVYLDDIVLSKCVAGGAPTPTHTPTRTYSATPTKTSTTPATPTPTTRATLTPTRRPGLRRVLFDEAHAEANTLSWQRAQALVPGHPEWVYFGALATTLADEFTLVRNADQLLTTALLSGYDALMLSVPTQPLTTDELASVGAFLARGGGVLVLGDPGQRDIVNALTRPRGINLDSYLLFAPGPDGDFNVDDFSPHPAVAGVSAYRTNWGGSLRVSSPAVALAFTDGNVFGDLDGEMDQDPGEPTGPFTIAAAYEVGPMRLAAVSDNPFQDDFFQYRNNAPLARALLRWLTAQRAGWASRVYLPVIVRE